MDRSTKEYIKTLNPFNRCIYRLIEISKIHPIDYIIHFLIFYILQRWSGISCKWSLGLVIAIEVWEAADYSGADIFNWFKKRETWIDVLAGIIGVIVGGRLWLLFVVI